MPTKNLFDNILLVTENRKARRARASAERKPKNKGLKVFIEAPVEKVNTTEQHHWGDRMHAK